MDYSIKNTTREQRLNLVKNSLGILLSDCKMPDAETQKLLLQYVNGEKELSEIKKEVLEKFKVNF